MSADRRRAASAYRSVFDFAEVMEHFIQPNVLSKEHVDRLLRACAEYPLSAMEDISIVPDWPEIVPSLPQAAYQLLRDLNFRTCTLQLVHESVSGRGDSKKLLLRLQDGLEVETCIMRYGSDETSGHRKDESGHLHFNSRRRATVCVSSQVGCRMGCTFCATGTLQMRGNLTGGEILEQILLANAIERRDRATVDTTEADASVKKYIRNVVFMGMGEPMDNYREVIRCIRLLTSSRIISVAPYRVTLSTVGYSPSRIKELIKDAPKISLALSLHAPTQELRDQIVPTSKVNKLESILEACYEFVDHQRSLSKSNQKRQNLLVEYCVISNINDSDETAHQLGQLLEPYKEKTMLNLIPYNKTDVGRPLETPSPQRVTAFHQIVRGYGIPSFVRQEFGADIDGACGQLASKHSMDTISEDSPEMGCAGANASILSDHARYEDVPADGRDTNLNDFQSVEEADLDDVDDQDVDQVPEQIEESEQSDATRSDPPEGAGERDQQCVDGELVDNQLCDIEKDGVLPVASELDTQQHPITEVPEVVPVSPLNLQVTPSPLELQGKENAKGPSSETLAESEFLEKEPQLSERSCLSGSGQAQHSPDDEPNESGLSTTQPPPMEGAHENYATPPSVDQGFATAEYQHEGRTEVVEAESTEQQPTGSDRPAPDSSEFVCPDDLRKEPENNGNELKPVVNERCPSKDSVSDNKGDNGQKLEDRPTCPQDEAKSESSAKVESAADLHRSMDNSVVEMASKSSPVAGSAIPGGTGLWVAVGGCALVVSAICIIRVLRARRARS